MTAAQRKAELEAKMAANDITNLEIMEHGILKFSPDPDAAYAAIQAADSSQEHICSACTALGIPRLVT